MNHSSFLNTDTLRCFAPSIFAEAPAEHTSSRYTQISTEALLEDLAGEGFLPTQASQTKFNRIHCKHLVRLRHVDAQPNSSGLFPELVLVNSHDGKSSYQLHSGVFRIFCLNGLISGDTDSCVRVRHQGDISGDVIEGTYKVIDSAKHAIEQAECMESYSLTPEQRMAFAQEALAIRYPDGLKAYNFEVRRLLSAYRQSDVGTDLFSTLNVVQERFMRGGTPYVNSKRTSILRTRPVKSVDENIRINKGLFQLATNFLAAA